MKYPIAWHEDNLDNMGRNIEQDRNQIINLKRYLDKHINQHLFLGEQIRQAKKQNKEGFDAERFMKKPPPLTENIKEKKHEN